MESLRSHPGLTPRVNAHLDLVDYRRQVFDIYRSVRGGRGRTAWKQWIDDRDRLFATHPQTPLDDPGSFTGLHYYDYDPAFRVLARVDGASDVDEVDQGHSGVTRFLEIGRLTFSLAGADHTLSLLWLDAYGGGLFLPFRDLTNGDTTYGGGRYLLDTVKGADLGRRGDDLILDFNFAYHPSCVHSNRWSCPLAPPENHLEIPITAGERLSTPNVPG